LTLKKEMKVHKAKMRELKAKNEGKEWPEEDIATYKESRDLKKEMKAIKKLCEQKHPEWR
jgi:hypothetical protein